MSRRTPDTRRDVHLEHAGERYVVRAVKRMDTLTDPGFRPELLEPVTWVVAPLMNLAARPLLRHSRRWRVGVLRWERRRLGSGYRLLRGELLPRGEPPEARMDELVTQVRAGRFTARGPGGG